MSRSHPAQWTITTDIDRAAPELVEAFRELDTSQIADSGGPVAVIDPGVLAVTEETDFCGSAVTLWTKPGDILFILKAPDLITQGDVLVIDGGGRLDAAVIGDIFSELVRDRGAVGMVVDGAVRDLSDLRKLGLPIFARGVHPATASKEGPGALNATVQCGGVVVEPGDIVRGDADGVVVIPHEAAESVLALARAVRDRETGWRADIRAEGSAAQSLGVDDLIATLSTAPDTTVLP
ncbi:RraA family protein [Ornithinimicrobium cavernae]|uniref:RraA family protein n=1 Tax=Ornithinimicrobium cavernae TaxID=2666047 RepID=UPI000D69E8CD|nr:dimethylmenaquinone methyltransferase [Ornithinimicrobium cavernae]